MMRDREVDTAMNSYLGKCKVCKKFTAIGGVSDMCWECKVKRNLIKTINH